jgi:hypothetical protein
MIGFVAAAAVYLSLPLVAQRWGEERIGWLMFQFYAFEFAIAILMMAIGRMYAESSAYHWRRYATVMILAAVTVGAALLGWNATLDLRIALAASVVVLPRVVDAATKLGAEPAAAIPLLYTGALSLCLYLLIGAATLMLMRHAEGDPDNYYSILPALWKRSTMIALYYLATGSATVWYSQRHGMRWSPCDDSY